MIGITLSLEQVRSAPPEVRRWIESEMAKVWNILATSERGQESPESSGLAACTEEEALRIFEAVKGDFFAAQVLLEFRREPVGVSPPLCAYRLADLLHHTHLSGDEQLAGCLQAISDAFRQIRRDPSANLFGLDRRGNCYVLEDTHRHVKALWAALVAAQTSGLATSTASSNPAAPRFNPHEAAPVASPSRPTNAGLEAGSGGDEPELRPVTP